VSTTARNATITPQVVAGVVGQGGLWTRQDIAYALGVPYSTHIKVQADLAYAYGLVEKFQGYSATHRLAWLYAPLGTMARLESAAEDTPLAETS
jgi:hypothetical protein